MNLILLFCEDFITPFDANSTSTHKVRLTGRRLLHVQNVHMPCVGDTLTVGLVNGKTGKGIITSLDKNACVLNVSLDCSPPPALPVTLLLALPRPKMLKRILQTSATMGVKKIVLINSYRVEKSFWQSPLLKPEAILEQLVLGLEQAKDTVLPEVILAKRFKPFIEDNLPTLAANTRKLVAHPSDAFQPPATSDNHTTLAVGPEGGFIDYEINKFLEIGFDGISLGPRILRVESAIPVLLASLF
jgi:16S rRNA (uracil1498-N3)-methyltransferase